MQNYFHTKWLDAPTIDCDEVDNLSLSCEYEEYSGGEMVSIDLRPNCIDSKLWLMSISVLFDIRLGVALPESELS